ncbi:unnamed protein product [Vitrella brassicaformis CCMP3155]|uniref:Uncharacterized protein n=1 Tax=Vitrella brassicaformis (strain CCMP3155) TaxID=1169540 RepID=A0A0G4F0E3_VITBC|nr:unnamed protein product [Vitrella brassicaformis CCMP3155]|eukprot:CEM05193.1 unnamed protein product [Vitrella brassicaformis CCMP3155]
MPMLFSRGHARQGSNDSRILEDGVDPPDDWNWFIIQPLKACLVLCSGLHHSRAEESEMRVTFPSATRYPPHNESADDDLVVKYHSGRLKKRLNVVEGEILRLRRRGMPCCANGGSGEVEDEIRQERARLKREQIEIYQKLYNIQDYLKDRRRYPDKRIPLPDMNLPDVGSGTADMYAPRGEVPTSMVRVGVSRPATTSTTGQRRVERGKGVRSSLAEKEEVVGASSSSPPSSKQTRSRDNVEVGGAGVDGVGGERRVSGKRSMSPSTALPTKASDMPFFTHDYPLDDDGDDRDDEQDDEGDNQDEGDRRPLTPKREAEIAGIVKKWLPA